MIPTVIGTDDYLADFTISEQTEYPSFTHKLLISQDRVLGNVNGQEAVKQAIYKLLNTERYEHVIYSSNYGVELRDLIGAHVAFVVPEAERRIKDALLWDKRITKVFDFNFDIGKKSIHVTFKCNTIFGELPIETEVMY